MRLASQEGFFFYVSRDISTKRNLNSVGSIYVDKSVRHKSISFALRFSVNKPRVSQQEET
jgi:hypothetical protein